MKEQIIKICGLRMPENIARVLELAPDWVGFILHPDSPRYVDVELLSNWIEQNAIRFGKTRRVGVFVHDSPQHIVSIAQKLQLQSIQLHGGQEVDEIMKLQGLLQDANMKHLQIIKVFAVDTDFDFDKCKAFEPVVDYFLFDTKTGKFGGSGLRFDWQLLDNYRGSIPFLIAGGIGHEAAEKIYHFIHPMFAGIDLNSKFECTPGVKDVSKLNHFITQLRMSN